MGLILLGVLGVGIGVNGAGDYPHFLVALLLGLVVLVQVLDGDKVIGITVDEEDRKSGFLKLIY